MEAQHGAPTGLERPPRRDAVMTWAVLAIMAIAVALMIFYDLQSDEPLVDEYARQWTLRRLAAGHGLQLWGTNASLVSILAAAPLTMLHMAPRFWRLPQLLFFALLPVYTYRLARRFGADRFWAMVAAAAITASPLTLGVTTGMMTETAYLGLLMAGAWYLLEWDRGTRSRMTFLALAFLATLQRDQGVGLVVVLVLAGLWRYRATLPRMPPWGQVAWVAGVGAVSWVALKLPGLFRGVAHGGFAPVHTRGAPMVIFSTSELPILIGFMLVPLAVALWSKFPAESSRTSRMDLLPFGVAVSGLAAAAGLYLVTQGQIFPGLWIGPWGIGPPQLFDIKPDFWPKPAFVALEVVTCGTFVVLFGRRRRAWGVPTLGNERALMVVLALVQILPLFAYTVVFDRYYLPIAAPLAPLAASLVTGSSLRSTKAQAWALTSLALLVGYYAVAEQDYLSWHVARAEAARIAYQTYRPWDVFGGFEMDTQHVFVPATDDPTGTLPDKLASCPHAFLAWASPGDPGPGATYQSLSPGRIVVRRTNCP